MLTLADYYRLKRKFFEKHSYETENRVLAIPVTLMLRQDFCMDIYTKFKIPQSLCRFLRRFLEETLWLPVLVYDYTIQQTVLPKNTEEVLTLINDIPLIAEPITVITEHEPYLEQSEPPKLWTFTGVGVGANHGKKPVIRIYANVQRVYEYYEEFKKVWESYVVSGNNEIKRRIFKQPNTKCSGYAYVDEKFYIMICF